MKKISDLGELDSDILDEWMFWKIINKNPVLYTVQEKMNYGDLQKMDAVMEMNDDYKSAFNAYFEDEQEKKLNNIKGK